MNIESEEVELVAETSLYEYRSRETDLPETVKIHP